MWLIKNRDKITTQINKEMNNIINGDEKWQREYAEFYGSCSTPHSFLFIFFYFISTIKNYLPTIVQYFQFKQKPNEIPYLHSCLPTVYQMPIFNV